MAAKIRVGIVGATVTPGGSGWGANAHVPALHALPDFELKAVCTAHEETAKASAAAFGAELAFHDIEEMVAHPDIDLVVVSVRVPGHHGLVMSALRPARPSSASGRSARPSPRPRTWPTLAGSARWPRPSASRRAATRRSCTRAS